MHARLRGSNTLLNSLPNYKKTTDQPTTPQGRDTNKNKIKEKQSALTSSASYSINCLKRPLKKKTKIGFQDRLSLNAGQKYWSILQYCRPSLSFNFSLRFSFCHAILSVRLRQVLL